MGPERRDIPDWARQERRRDLEWIGEYFEVFWITASLAYEDLGRGAIVVDTTTRLPGAGHPFVYAPQEVIEERENEDARRMVREYDPSKEVVIMLWKEEGRSSTYRAQLQRRDSPGRGGNNA